MQILPEIPQPTPRVRPEPPEPSRESGFDDAMRSAGARERRNDVEPRATRPADDRPAESARPHADGAERRSATQDRTSTSDREPRIDDPRSDHAEDRGEADRPQDTAPADTTPVDTAAADETPVEDDRAPDQSVEAAPPPVETPPGDVAARTDGPDLAAPVSTEDAPPAPTTVQPDGEPAADVALKSAITDDLVHQTEGAAARNQTAKSDAMINGVDPDAASKTEIPAQTPEVRPTVTPGQTPPAGPVTADVTAPAPITPPTGTTAESAAMASQQVAAAAKTGATGGNEAADLTADDPKSAAQAGERARPQVSGQPEDMPHEGIARDPAKRFNVSELIPTAQPANAASAKAEPAPPAAMTAALGDPALGQLQPGAGLSTFTTGTGSVNTVSAAAAQSAYTRGGEAAQPPAQQVAIQISRAVQEGTDRITVQLKPAALGRISVDLEVGHDNRIIAVIAAERSETLELLQRDAKALERALADAGLKTDSGSLSFNLQGQTDQQGRTDDGGKAASGSLNLPHENDEPEPQMAAHYDRETGHGGIDLRV